MPNARLWIAGNEVVVSNDIALTVSGVDLATPNEINGAFTNEISLPVISENTRVLGAPTDLTRVNDPLNKRYAADVEISGISVLRGGIAQTTGVSPEEYNLRIFGAGSPLFERMKKNKLADLDYSALDHTWGVSDASASAGYDYSNGYTYPLIQSGRNGQTVANGLDIRYTLPTIYCRWILNTILNDYALVSDLTGDDRFNALSIAWGGDVPQVGSRFRDSVAYTSAQASSDLVKTTTQAISPAGGFPQTYDLSQYMGYYPYGYFCSANGTYNFTFTGAFGINVTLNNCTASTLNSYLAIWVNGVLQSQTLVFTGSGASGTILRTLSATLTLNAGDVVECGVRQDAVITGKIIPPQPASFTFTTTYYSASDFRTITEMPAGALSFGGTVNFEQLVPDMTCADFVKMVAGIFNAQMYVNDSEKLVFLYSSNYLASLAPETIPNVSVPFVSRSPITGYGQKNVIEYKNNPSLPKDYGWGTFEIANSQLSDRVAILPIPISSCASAACSGKEVAYIRRWVQDSSGAWSSNGGDSHALVCVSDAGSFLFTDGSINVSAAGKLAKFNTATLSLEGIELLSAYFGTCIRAATYGEVVRIRAYLHNQDFAQLYSAPLSGGVPRILRPYFIPELNGLYFISKVSESIGDSDTTDIELIRLNPLNAV